MTVWYILISLPLLPVFLLFILCMVIYKMIVYLILKLRFGTSAFLVSSLDSIFALGKFEENMTYILAIVKTDLTEEESKDKIVRAAEESVIKNKNHFKKLHSSLRSFMGYSFLVKHIFKAEDFVTLVDVDKNYYESINHLVYDYSTTLSEENEVLFECIILKCSKEWKAKNHLKSNQMPILIRYHHMLGDGLSLLNVLMHILEDNKLIMNQIVEKFNRTYKRPMLWIRIFQNIFSFLLIPGFIIMKSIERYTNRRISWDIVGTGKQFVAYKMGDDMLIKNIKEIKKKHGKCSFTEVILAAVSASLYDYFKKKNLKIPITIETAVPISDHLKQLNQNGLPLLTNQLTLTVFELPIDVESNVISKRITALQNYSRSSHTKINFLITRMILSYLVGLFPKCIRKGIFKLKYNNIGMSSLPELPKIVILKEMEMEETYFFIVNKISGIGFSLVTYNNKIHFGIKAFENIICSQEECQLVLDNIVKHLNSVTDQSYVVKL